MGQGVYTSISMILAEELDADWRKVEVAARAAQRQALRQSRCSALQVTGNSNSIRAFWKPLREAGASARAMLVQAAAAQWQVDPASCTTSKGEVTHAASGRKLGYGALATGRAAARRRRRTSPLKDPKDFVYIGQPLKRLDTPDKVNGKAVYGIDAMLPDMKFATIAALPGVRRQGRQGRRQRGEEGRRRAQGRRARRHRRRGRRSHVGGEEGPRGAQDRRGTRARTPGSAPRTSGRTCAPPARRTARSRNPSATSPRRSPAATSSRRPTSCRSSRTRRWSRSTPPCTSSRTPARSGSARRS